ncbi:D-Ala-D-Ala dipeptidase VanX [Galbitalea sp. SE-J8]|uniref:D-Ala-D-Ala dipeptidase VanX n=1 Tax=Galbitalea sp. SE-J8 TaxID=3054952 RepID=UPI00259C69B1|nr:D-Ala-D-Ala dipeptidase VanX [Galbitalea sp. SE-J8]MDM4763991.1 D-Ala-D-Ala dipeptidase VanX [Galbitalea sp. SE-J8]
MNPDFAFVDEVVPGIRWDAKYATWDNFTGKPVDGYVVNRMVASRAMCDGLRAARDAAASAGLGLLLWDAYRPQRAVDAFLRWSQEPEDAGIRARFHPRITRVDMIELGYVATRSGHSRGAAVDLTAYALDTGALLAMGTRHDLMDVRSHHGAEGVTAEETRNRETLRGLMEGAGFVAFENEWWHYSLRDEPFPDEYFDFPIDEHPADEHPADEHGADG